MAGQQANPKLARVFGGVSALCGLATILLLGGAIAFAAFGPEPKGVQSGRGLVLALLLLIVLPVNGLLALLGIVCGIVSAWKGRIGDWGDVAWAMVGVTVCVFMLAVETVFVVLTILANNP
jgi:hypothetical protein